MDITAIEMLLLHYASGNLGPAEGLIAAAHVSLNREARRKLAEFEALGGQVMLDHTPVAVTEECLSSVLSKINAAPSEAGYTDTILNQDPLLADVPCAIKKLLLGHCATRRKWRPIAAGQSEIMLRIDSPNPCRHQLRLIRLEQGAQMRLTHRARIMMLIMAGQTLTAGKLFHTGDMILAEAHSTFPARIDITAGQDGCTVLTLTYPAAPWWRRVF